MSKLKNRRRKTPSPVPDFGTGGYSHRSEAERGGRGEGDFHFAISAEIATLPRDRVSIVERVLDALAHSRRVWIEELTTPVRWVWIVGAFGIAQYISSVTVAAP